MVPFRRRACAASLLAAAAAAACSLTTKLDGLTGGSAACGTCACTKLTAPLGIDAGLTTWRVAGNAQLAGPYAELTQTAENQAGLLAWSSVVDLSRFELTFAFSISADAQAGMGMTFAAMGAPAADLACRNDYALCLLGQNVAGFAVILRTAQFSGHEPQAPFIAVVDTNVDPLGALPAGSYASLPPWVVTKVPSVNESQPPPDDSWHTLALAVADGKLDATLDGQAVLSGVALPSAAPRQGTWALGASTDYAGGGLFAVERVAVRDVVLTTEACGP